MSQKFTWFRTLTKWTLFCWWEPHDMFILFERKNLWHFEVRCMQVGMFANVLFTRTDIQPDTDIQKYQPDNILYWRIEYRPKWVLYPFCPTKSLSPLTQCYSNIGPIFLNVSMPGNQERVKLSKLLISQINHQPVKCLELSEGAQSMLPLQHLMSQRIHQLSTRWFSERDLLDQIVGDILKV